MIYCACRCIEAESRCICCLQAFRQEAQSVQRVVKGLSRKMGSGVNAGEAAVEASGPVGMDDDDLDLD